MAGAFVQETHGVSGFASSFTPTLATGVTASNVLVLAIRNDGGSGFNASSVSGCGATWSRLQGPTSADSINQGELWIGTGVTSGTTVTVTMTGGCRTDYLLSEYSGVNGAVTSAAASGTASTSPATASVSATAIDQVAYAAIFHLNTTGALTSFSDTPAAFTTASNDYDATNTEARMHGYRITTATGAHSRTGTAPASGTWIGFGVILGTVSGPAPFRRPPVTVRSRAVARAAVI